MGVNQSGEVSNNYLKEFSLNYKFVKEQNDPRFGLIKVFKNKDSEEEVMIVRRMYTSDEEYEYFQRELNLRLGFQHKNLLHLLGYQKESNANLCGHSRVFELYSEYHSHNLKKEIQKRTSSLDYFSEAELWYLAESCLSIGCFLQEHNIYHGDYRPINIMLSDDGYVKLPDNGILSAIKNNYFKTLSGECRGYLSPELMRFFSKRDPSPKYNVYKADVFSLGITLLYASTLRRPNTVCYDWSQYMLNNRGIMDLLKGVEARYSVAWRELLENMLSIEKPEDGRPDFLFLFPLKVTPPRIEQKPVVHFREEMPPLPPPRQKDVELHLIKTQNFEDRTYENQVSSSYGGYQQYQQPAPQAQTYQLPQPQLQPQSQVPQAQTYQLPQPQLQPQSQVFTSQIYQQPPTQQYMYSSYEQEQPIVQQTYTQPTSQQPYILQQSPSKYNVQNFQYAPEINQNQVSSIYGSQYYNQQSPQPIILQQQPVSYAQLPIQQSVAYTQPQIQQQQISYAQPQGFSAQAYNSQTQVYNTQPQVYTNQQIDTNSYALAGQYQPATQSAQYQVQSNLVNTQNMGGIYESNMQRGEVVKRAGAPVTLQTVREEKIEKFEDNDLDKRVREALKATQDTIDRNSRMQMEAQKYQYGNNA